MLRAVSERVPHPARDAAERSRRGRPRRARGRPRQAPQHPRRHASQNGRQPCRHRRRHGPRRGGRSSGTARLTSLARRRARTSTSRRARRSRSRSGRRSRASTGTSATSASPRARRSLRSTRSSFATSASRESKAQRRAVAAAADKNVAVVDLAEKGKSEAAMRAVELWSSVYGAEAGQPRAEVARDVGRLRLRRRVGAPRERPRARASGAEEPRKGAREPVPRGVHRQGADAPAAREDPGCDLHSSRFAGPPRRGRARGEAGRGEGAASRRSCRPEERRKTGA